MPEAQGGLSSYERKAWAEVQTHREKQLSTRVRRVVPQRVQRFASDHAAAAKAKVADTAAGGKAVDGAASAFRGVGALAQRAVGKSSQATLSDRRVVKAFQRRGHAVEDLAAIRNLDLSVVDAVRPRRLDLTYSILAGAEGAVAGAVVSGGEALAVTGSVASAGAAAAPSVGVLAGALAADSAFTLTATSRAVGHIAMYYGYDPSALGEELFAFSVINLGTAGSSSAKYAAYRELSQLAQQLARRATWKTLNEHLLTRIAQRFATDMSVRLTQRKLGQLVPVAGIFIGATLNFATLNQVCEAANWAYRERFLSDKQGGVPFILPDTPDLGPVNDAEDQAPEAVIDLLSIIQEEQAAEEVREPKNTTKMISSTSTNAPEAENG